MGYVPITDFYLIRHGSTEHIGNVLSGRMPGVMLSEDGQTEADILAGFNLRVQYLLCSPLERTVQTAEIIAQANSPAVQVQVDAAFNEIDFGEWTGKSFKTLEDRPEWQAWNTRRGTSVPPEGESMEAAQARAISRLYTLNREFPRAKFAIVTHAEIIRAILLHALNMTLDDFWKIEISPASLSFIEVTPGGMRVLAMNWRHFLPR